MKQENKKNNKHNCVLITKQIKIYKKTTLCGL